MAGHVIHTFLKNRKKYEILGTTNKTNFILNTVELDIFKIGDLLKIIKYFKPDIVINCIGMLIRDSLTLPDKTIYANSYLPHYLARLASEKSFKLIHISTDCVFSGKEGPYNEKSPKNASDLYGMSKSLGEIIDNTNLTIRTSIIGPELKDNGEGLFNWVLSQKDKIYGFKSNIWSGVTTFELSKFIDHCINFDLTGLVHLTNNTPISKYELLTIINREHNLNLTISDEKDYVSDKSFINTNSKILFKVSNYDKMIIEQREFMIDNKSFYNHYYSKI